MELIVRLDENGHFRAYDISTPEKHLKVLKQFVDQVYPPRKAPEEPSYSRESIPNLPKEFQAHASGLWGKFDNDLKLFNERKELRDAVEETLAGKVHEHCVKYLKELLEEDISNFEFVFQRGTMEEVELED